MAKKRNTRNKNKKAVVTKKVPISNNINTDAIVAALNTINKPVLLKVCRLCETKDGPFLNIFDSDRITAKKIEEVLPYVIAANDDLPHKICFRCSAKVEELYEFIQKCVKTEVNLRRASGKTGPLPNKSYLNRSSWEEKLNKSNISNDDICDALIKKAIESIKDIPSIKTLKSGKGIGKEVIPNVKDKEIEKEIVKDTSKDVKNNMTELNKDLKDEPDSDNVPLKKIKIPAKKNNEIPSNPISSDKEEPKINEKLNKTDISDVDNIPKSKNKTEGNDNSKSNETNNENISKLEEVSKPFDILDHVSMIKVNGVGVLFQCKLCNRNFLKKEVVLSHGCAKSGGTKKIEAVKDPPAQPELPKLPSVKYINTKVDSEVKKTVNLDEPITLDDDDDDDDKPLIERKKPKIGPASKVRKANGVHIETPSKQASNKTPNVTQTQAAENVDAAAPIVQIPNMPSLNSRYKLVRGPNNTFTLVEEGADKSSEKPIEILENPKTTEPSQETKSNNKNKAGKKVDSAAVTKEESLGKPYPVGLFQTVPHNANLSMPTEPTSFPTPAMKKQNYTVVQTGNPSKLLISTKPPTPVADMPKKKQRKTKNETKKDDSSKEPFSITLEDAAPTRRDPGFFTFINVDPLLQPSYVLPTDNIIQESQISTSTNVSQNQGSKDMKYTCNICNEKFSREKKLLTHIRSHYDKIDDDEDTNVAETPNRKRVRSSIKK